MSKSDTKIPAIVLGGTGYVAGELLRLIAAHPHLELKAVLSDSQPGESVAKSFTHLAPAYPELKFSGLEAVTQLVGSLPQSAVLSAAPHGVAAKLIDDLLTGAEARGAKPKVIDISADYRYTTPQAYETVYKHAHGAPSRIRSSPAPCRSTSIRSARRMWRIPAASPRQCCSRACLCSSSA
jgi:N-acetyl-gamma-glutamyl-phosphate reductase